MEGVRKGIVDKTTKREENTSYICTLKEEYLGWNGADVVIYPKEEYGLGKIKFSF